VIEAQQQDTEAIRALLQRITAAWTQGPLERLADCFHDAMVIVSPRFQDRAEGRAACIESYREFVETATLQRYRQGDPDIHVVGETAVAAYRFEIIYTIDTTDFQEAGWDVFMFARTSGAWLAVWRTVIPSS
jgi:uncharacterized protein (TIGR02246 family)